MLKQKLVLLTRRAHTAAGRCLSLYVSGFASSRKAIARSCHGQRTAASAHPTPAPAARDSRPPGMVDMLITFLRQAEERKRTLR